MNTTPEEKPNAPLPMPTTSSASVRVFWLNRPQILQRLQKALQDLTTRHHEIEQVVLFGSLARGDAVPGSDADLLLIVHDSPWPFLARSIYYRPAHVGIGVDVFVYTQAELQAMLAAGNPFVAQALREGVTLFQRS
jgi:predicted nucleotidyltransferase